MKKYLKIIFLFLPLISFAQLTSEEQVLIENYVNKFCPCINNVINTLDPKVVEFVNLMADEGEKKAMIQIQEYVSTHSEEEAKKLITGFDKMSSPEFGKKIEKCDNKEGMSSEMTLSIDNSKGEYSEYFYNYLTTTIECKMTNYIMLLGNQVAENKE